MPSCLDARLRRLETQVHAGIQWGNAALLEWGQRNGLDRQRIPLAALSDAELDAKLAALAGQSGFSLLWQECLEEERALRQACTQEPPT